MCQSYSFVYLLTFSTSNFYQIYLKIMIHSQPPKSVTCDEFVSTYTSLMQPTPSIYKNPMDRIVNFLWALSGRRQYVALPSGMVWTLPVIMKLCNYVIMRPTSPKFTPNPYFVLILIF